MTDALTLDEAVEIELADDAAQLPATVQPEPIEDFIGDLDAEVTTEGEGGSLTLEQAMAIDLADEDSSARSEDFIAYVDGHGVTLAELVDGYIEAKQTRHHMASVNSEYQRLIAGAHGIVAASWRLAELLTDNAPPPPSPGLAQVNPNLYIAQQAIRNAIDQFTQEALEAGNEAEQTAYQLFQHQHLERLKNEAVLLAEHVPEAREPHTRNELLRRIRTVVAYCGFSDAEVDAAVDHRLFRLARLAAIGLEVEEREKTHPMPKKRKRRHHSDALKRLAMTGSIEDAMAVDIA